MALQMTTGLLSTKEYLSRHRWQEWKLTGQQATSSGI